ncbi:MAG: outer membrane lipoprotein carrier protein LolA [Bacteroidetes bacterium]|nr:outer membrane lipoprotein carrier protein LolA [Bacteroidota bacterium]
MCKRICIVLVLLYAFSVKAQYAGYTLLANSTTFKDQFSAASQKINTIQSDFTQEKNLSMLSEKILSKGKFWFRKESLVRMEYNQPFKYLMILNNGKVYIKDAQKENTVAASSNKLFRQINNIMIDCMKGSALSNPDFVSRIFEGAQSYLVELTPTSKNLKDFFQHINIVVDKKDFTATNIEMYEPGGDNTIIHFNNKQLNATIPETLFAIH